MRQFGDALLRYDVLSQHTSSRHHSRQNAAAKPDEDVTLGTAKANQTAGDVVDPDENPAWAHRDDLCAVRGACREGSSLLL